MRRRTAWIAIATASILAMSLAAPAHAQLRTDDYPSWDEVQAAKSNAASAKAEVDKITALVANLQTAANAAAADELKKAAAYTVAKNALDAATVRATNLQAQSTNATAEAATANKLFGQFVSQQYISGGTSYTTQLLLSGHSKAGNSNSGNSAGDLLSKLGAMRQLSGHTSQLRIAAEQKQNIADATAKQAQTARQLRDQLASEAEDKLAAAKAAQAAADTELAKQQSVSATLYAQAAALNNTEASVEQQYYAGVAAAAAAEANSHNGGSDGDNIDIDTSGVVVDPAGAQAYARDAMGAYGWGGDQFGCLVDLWNHESGWRANAYNPSSAAYGIPQAWPGTKMASSGSDWRTNAATQINWGLGYINDAYGSPCAAWSFEMSHDPNWY